jgi:hypothetical protein
MTQAAGARSQNCDAGGTVTVPASGPIRGLEGYALACRRVGQRVLPCGNTWWREVRPCFFRPILPFLDVPSGSVGLPRRAVLGGWQYPARGPLERPNSSLVYIAFLESGGYTIQRLHARLRSYVRSAERRFVVRRLSNGPDFKARAHPLYIQFYERTKYNYLASRLHRQGFDRWVDAEFGDPGLVALGAWDGDALAAVSLSRAVGNVWVYSSFFASNEAVRAHVANLLLHHVRGLAATDGGIDRVFVGMQKLGEQASLDAFFLHRGAEYIRRPAILRVNPIAKWMLTHVRPDLWAQLRGGPDTGANAPDSSP